MKVFAVLMVASLMGFNGYGQARSGFDWSAFEHIAIQDHGRIKPFDTFARESLQLVSGSQSWHGMPAIECLAGWIFAYDKEWAQEKFIRIDYPELKKKLGLVDSDKYFSPSELRSQAPRLESLLREIARKERLKEGLSELENRAIRVQNQLGLLDAIASGRAIAILPNPKGADWVAIGLLDQHNSPFPSEKVTALFGHLGALSSRFAAMDANGWQKAALDFSGILRELGGPGYPSYKNLHREVHYNGMRPFRWSWIFYGIAFLLFVLSFVIGSSYSQYAGMVAIVVGFVLHSYGFILRCVVSGRPPVTNMYESVIWVAWGAVLFAFMLYIKYRKGVLLAASSVFAVVGLILADNLPSVLDPSLHPLEPVLRSNFWLAVHVLTITSSYAAFGLSLVLGNVVLGNYLFKPHQTNSISQLTLYMYRAEQIGVILLAAGTILGGVWADYSWGRFWGWDPKEVWALIALLVYLAVLHGRFAGWLKGFGFVTATVLCFLAVLMAWYGVNFVLGVGLHAYGFGTGGLPWIVGYIVLQIGFIGAAYLRHAGSFKSL
ncbi:MAG: cytochrome c biogenesis protein CcsA [Deltaproteobacteria bacterium]|nr:cytochrome c biogenesis protein CcsA [Deltaproteobacteria bacterium]